MLTVCLIWIGVYPGPVIDWIDTSACQSHIRVVLWKRIRRSNREREANKKAQERLDTLCINTIRTLAMDAVQKADSGHPGTPMALAPLAYVLWTKFLRYNPENPKWFNRDRFILSAGHASMLQYAMLFLTGYDLSLDDIKNFRQWASRTPGHPEYGRTPGIDTTTGPLGQGFMNAVGMAMAEAHLAAVFNRPGHDIVDHYTYGICSDGDLMEGASHEAASIAGHLKLGKLIFVYDDNHISIEGKTELAFSDDVARRFEGYHWHVQNLGEKANDLAAITRALRRAQQEKDRPSLIILRTHIGYGAPHMQDTKEAHGQALGEDEVKLTKRVYGWPEDEHFYVPQEVLDYMRQAKDRGRELEAAWNQTVRRLQATERAPGPAVRSIRPWGPARRLGGRDSRIPGGQGPDGHAGRGQQGAQRHRPQGALADGRQRRPLALDQDADRGFRLLGGRTVREPQHRLGRARARDVRVLFRPGAARRDSPLRRDVLHLHRLRPARHSPGRDDGTAGDLHHDARLHRLGRGRSHAPAGRAPGLVSGHAAHVRDPPGRRQRDRLGLAGRHDARQKGPRCSF